MTLTDRVPGLALEKRRARFARRSLASDVLITCLWASGAVAVALYLSSGSVGRTSSAAEIITTVGAICGLVGCNYILVMLVLAARIPLLDRTIGHEQAIAVHRTMGKPALYLLLAHAALLLTGYGMSAGVNPIAEIIPMLSIPDMPLAFIALGLMITVVVTSLVAVRRRFSYEAWHLIHLLSYVAVAFAIPHQLSVGGVLADSTWQRYYWIALYVIAFGTIAVFRFVVPVVSSVRHGITVAAISPVAPGVTSMFLRGRGLSALNAVGGQFFIWRFLTRKTWWHSHPITLSALPTDTVARITVRGLGDGSSRVLNVPVGTRVMIEGPYGLFTSATRIAPKVAFVAAGIGVTPIRAMLEQGEFGPGEATVLLRASQPDEAYLWDEIEQLATRRGAACYSLVGPRASGANSWMSVGDAQRGVTIESILPDLANTDLYLCGPGGWLDSISAAARAAGVPRHQIHSERFDW